MCDALWLRSHRCITGADGAAAVGLSNNDNNKTRLLDFSNILKAKRKEIKKARTIEQKHQIIYMRHENCNYSISKTGYKKWKTIASYRRPMFLNGFAMSIRN